MLILYRKKGDGIMIGDNITISVTECGADGVRLAIEAPREVAILRKELLEAAEANREAAKSELDSAGRKEALMKMKELIKQKEHK